MSKLMNHDRVCPPTRFGEQVDSKLRDTIQEYGRVAM